MTIQHLWGSIYLMMIRSTFLNIVSFTDYVFIRSASFSFRNSLRSIGIDIRRDVFIDVDTTISTTCTDALKYRPFVVFVLHWLTNRREDDCSRDNERKVVTFSTTRFWMRWRRYVSWWNAKCSNLRWRCGGLMEDWGYRYVSLGDNKRVRDSRASCVDHDWWNPRVIGDTDVRVVVSDDHSWVSRIMT